MQQAHQFNRTVQVLLDSKRCCLSPQQLRLLQTLLLYNDWLILMMNYNIKENNKSWITSYCFTTQKNCLIWSFSTSGTRLDCSAPCHSIQLPSSASLATFMTVPSWSATTPGAASAPWLSSVLSSVLRAHTKCRQLSQENVRSIKILLTLSIVATWLLFWMPLDSAPTTFPRRTLETPLPLRSPTEDHVGISDSLEKHLDYLN